MVSVLAAAAWLIPLAVIAYGTRAIYRREVGPDPAPHRQDDNAARAESWRPL